MSRRYLLSILAAVVLVSSAGFARQTAPPDLTGTWNGVLTSAEDPKGDAAVLILKQTGTELTGSAGPSPERQLPMLKGGKVTTTKEGTSATFAVGNETVTLHFDLKLVEGHLKGALKAERGDGQQRTGTADFERAKAAVLPTR